MFCGIHRGDLILAETWGGGGGGALKAHDRGQVNYRKREKPSGPKGLFTSLKAAVIKDSRKWNYEQ
jgi:hypothetical protein